jgi:tripartite ATP-independent transporter DctM subunit
MNEIYIGLVGLALVLVLFLTGIELGFCMALVGFLGFAYLVSMKAGMNLLAKDFIDVFMNYGFTVIPLFVLMGQAAFNAGIAKRLYNSAYRFIGHVPGGLAMATVFGATAFKAICGSSPATAATFASVAVPEMDRYNYSRKLSTGIVATVGTLGILLPPSVTLIVFGVITEQSIGKLFLAGMIPGLMIAFFFLLIIYAWCRLNPALGPRGERSTWKQRIATLPEVLWVVIIFVAMIYGLMSGKFTPTEAGSVGTFLVLVLSFVKRDMGIKGYIKSVSESLRTACMVLTLIAGSQVLGHFLARTKIPMLAADWIVSLPLAPWIVMILICLIYLVGGSFIDDLAFMILATPIFYPVIAKLGYDPIWFGIMIMITVMIGVVIPPVAINVFVVRAITRESFSVIYGGVYPFLLSLVFGAVLLFINPKIATLLPNNPLSTKDWLQILMGLKAFILECGLISLLWAVLLRATTKWIGKFTISFKKAYGTCLLSLLSIIFVYLFYLAIGAPYPEGLLSRLILLISFLAIWFYIQVEIVRAHLEVKYGKASLINLTMFAFYGIGTWGSLLLGWLYTKWILAVIF